MLKKLCLINNRNNEIIRHLQEHSMLQFIPHEANVISTPKTLNQFLTQSATKHNMLINSNTTEQYTIKINQYEVKGM